MMPNSTFDEMNRLLDAMRRSMMTGRSFTHGIEDTATTPMRLETDEDGFLVHADLPGFETEDIDLRFDENVLTVEAVHESDDETRMRTRRVSERLRVPEGVIVEEIEASYNNGVLEVRLPVDPDIDEESGHRIEID
jgi:HSP20 family protein